MWGSPGLQAPQTSRSLLSAFLSCKAPIFLASLPPMAPFCESLWPLFCLQGLPDSTVFSVWNRFCHLRVLEFRHVSPPASDYSPIKRRGWFLFWLMGLLASGKNSSVSFSCPGGGQAARVAETRGLRPRLQLSLPCRTQSQTHPGCGKVHILPRM